MITFQVQVNSTGGWTDRTNHVLTKSVQRMEVLSREASTMRFSVKSPVTVAKAWVPTVNDAVKVLDNDGTTVLFLGTIIEVNRSIEAMLVTYDCVAKDQTHKLDALTVLESYSSKTVNYIINDIVTKYAPTFTVMNVNCTTVIDAVKFNDLKPSECINKLIDMLGDHVWYVDYNNDIHFFKKYSRVAPFSLGQNDDSFIGNSLNIKRSIDQLRNSVYVRGGTVAGATVTEQKKADGSQKQFSAYKGMDNITIKKNTVIQTLGTDGVDDPGTKDVLYNPTSGLFKFTVAPANGDTIEWQGNPVYNIKVLVEDMASVGKYGRRQFRIVDESIKSSTSAKQRARAELAKYAERVNEGGFRTDRAGLKIGQEIRILLPALGIDEYFIISRVTSVLRTQSAFQHDVSLIASETLNTVDVLTKLLVQNPADAVQSTDEILTYALFFIEEVIVADTFVAVARPSATPTFAETVLLSDSLSANPWGNTNSGFIPVIGNYIPSNPTNDRKRTGLIGRTWMLTKSLVKNGLFYDTRTPSVPTTSSGKWIDGTAGGGTTDIFGWYLSKGGAGSATANAEITPRSLKLNIPVANAYIEVKGQATGYPTGAGDGFAMLPNTKYKLRGEIKLTVTSGSSSTGAHIALLMANGAGTNTQEVSIGSVTTTQDWTYYETEVTTVGTIARGHVECRLYGHLGGANLIGTAEFRNLSVEPA